MRAGLKVLSIHQLFQFVLIQDVNIEVLTKPTCILSFSVFFFPLQRQGYQTLFYKLLKSALQIFTTLLKPTVVHSSDHSHPQPPYSLTSSSGCAKKFEFFHWLTKNECAAEMKISKLYAFHFTSGPDGSTFAGALYEKKAKQMLTIPD